jgi:DNA-binding NarL/FixJ family response regulator
MARFDAAQSAQPDSVGLGVSCNTGVGRLNQRQRDVLFLLCKGLRNAEIAQQLKLSERTIKGYVSQLFLIFDVTNRTELVGTAVLSGEGEA